MGFAELFLVAVALSMDAFAVAVVRGLKMNCLNYRHAAIIAFFFGGFQALMPLVGYVLGSSFARHIERFDHWIAFALLALIGGKMIYEALKPDEGEDEEKCDSLDYKELTLFSIAGSIDALAVGVTFSLLPAQSLNIVSAAALIGLVTAVISYAGVLIGNRFGVKYQKRAELFGGIVLVILGLQILLEHLGVL
ncbi:MAG: manganese efflux pump MntP family protein [Oscillospiraceae bacterium]|jgi:putative Mn2+ efflux pump MntP|nr:manganese efflux pump MntP family protein [Oscillospiraceae bacterium]